MSQTSLPKDKAELVEIWNNLSLTRKIGLGTLVIAALTGLVFFFTWAQTPDYSAAFTDLNSDDGAAVVEYLKENKIPYTISNGGGTINVPSDQVHEVRLALASQGLPGKGTVGMELFDTATLGMTDFTQQVNYQRALEGELARTISSLTAVRSARVHIVIPQPTLFSEDEEPATASVVVDLEPNQRLGREQVQAISHLISSAVEGLTPDKLTIVDMDGNVLADGTTSTATVSVALSANQLEAQRNFEQDLELRIESMLHNVLGPDKAVVRASAQMNWDQVQTESETYVPGEEGSVVRSSRELSEVYNGDGTSTGGIPGVASNIPDAAASYQTEISGTNNSAYQRSDVTTNYEVSRSVSHITAATGKMEKLSVSVMVDNITDTVTIDAIEQATIAAAGIDTTRGDIVIVNSIPFDRSVQTEQEVAVQEADTREFYLKLAQWGAVAIALIALFFVVRAMQRSLRPAEVLVAKPEELPTALLEKIGETSKVDQLVAEIDGLATIGPPQFDSAQKAAAEKMQMLRQLQLVAKNRPETLAQVIQFWLANENNL
ncbi:MAG: flagellar basal-body MS-ring/collar protein FliF [Chloroflexota bacterium]